MSKNGKNKKLNSGKGMKIVCFMIMLALGIASMVLAVENLCNRIEASKQYSDYQVTQGVVTSVNRHQHWDSEGDAYYRYSITVAYTDGEGNTGSVSTEDIYESKPLIRKVKVLYKDGDAQVARRDMRTGKYVPVNCEFEVTTTIAMLFAGISVFILSVFLSKRKCGNWISVIGMILVGGAGLYGALYTSNYKYIFLIPIGLAAIPFVKSKFGTDTISIG